MPDQKRFSEEAIAEIFRQASEAQAEARNRTHAAEGLTLEELQAIGAEAGLSPGFVAQAAARLGRQEAPAAPAPRFLGFRIGVRRETALPQLMDDPEWEQLVADLRSTFQARGKVSQVGRMREWHNGNLYCVVEPTPDGGSRVRMGSLKGSAREMMTAGVGISIISLVGFLILLVSGDLDWASFSAVGVVFAAAIGIGVFPFFSLPSWASTREAQMEGIGARALERQAGRAEASGTHAPARLEPVESDLLDLGDAPETEAAPAARTRDRS